MIMSAVQLCIRTFKRHSAVHQIQVINKHFLAPLHLCGSYQIRFLF